MGEQELFLSLMQSAGVCFLRRDADETLGLEAEYVAPDLLPEKGAVADQLAGRWNDNERTARIEFRYPFLHTSLMRGFICDAGQLAHENGVYWKYGVWVYDRESGARALIEHQGNGQGGGTIVASVQQGHSERLARWLREHLARHNRRFGYPDLAPVIDELPRIDEKQDGIVPSEMAGKRIPDESTEGGSSEIVAGQAVPMPSEPTFGPLPPRSFPPREPEVYVSYAWGDPTPEGQRRGAVVDAICAALDRKRVRIHRDAADLDTGDRISEFMDRLINGDVIVTVLSDMYLRSSACMNELFGIYRRCGERSSQFLDHIIPIVLPDAKISQPVDRLEYAGYWRKRKDELETALNKAGFEVAGVEIPKEFALMGDFARKVADMLTYVNDKLFPRDVGRMEKDGFADIIKLIDKSRSR